MTVTAETKRAWMEAREILGGAPAPLGPRFKSSSILLARILTRRQQLAEASRAKSVESNFGPPVLDETLSDSDFVGVARVPKGELSEGVLEDVLKASVPTVLEGAGSESEAVQRWSIEYLRDNFGHFPVPTFRELTGEDVMSMAEVMDHILADGDPSIQVNNACNVLLEGEGLLDQLPIRAMADRAKSVRYHGANLFVCGKGGGSKYHCANEVNFFMQIYGKKTWHFIHPKYTERMDPRFTVPRCTYFGSGLEWGEHPPGVPIGRVTLNPGDILVNPPWWWHWVRNDTTTIGVATRWLSWKHRFGTDNKFFSGLQWMFPHQWGIMWKDYIKGGTLDDQKWVHREPHHRKPGTPDPTAPKPAA